MKDWSDCIRPARQSDALVLHRNCFPEDARGSVEEYLRWCLARQEGGRMLRLVAEVDGTIVANGQLDVHLPVAEIGSLVVAVAYRRQGIGAAMIRALLQAARDHHASSVEIMVVADHLWIRDWYHRMGFVETDIQIWPARERIIVLRRQITDSTH